MKLKSSFLIEAIERGFFYQSTNIEGLDEYLSAGSRYGYVGTDLTAKSLHVGHLIPIFLLRLFKKHGHKPILLVGGGTTKIGDPSFRNSARPMLSDDQIAENLESIKKGLDFILGNKNENEKIEIVNNAHWLDSLNYIDMLRNVGRYFSVNRMIGFDSVKTKLSENNSLSFLEFNYMIIQAYDFYHLFTEKDCRIQFGGQDQWGNIVCGVELIRKKIEQEAFGYTVPLLLKKDGTKMGKTANGAVWISKEMMSPYDFWQYWRNIDDADVGKCLRLFTDLDLSEIKRLEDLKDKEINEAKKILANEITKIIHGEDELSCVLKQVSSMFDANVFDENNAPSVSCAFEDFSIVNVLVESKISSSKSEARRLIRGGGVVVNDETITEEYSPKSKDVLKVCVGKKRRFLVKFID